MTSKFKRVVVQARMGSSRRPGKIAAELGNRTLLGLLIARLRLGITPFPGAEIVVATTTDPSDDITEQLARSEGAGCFRGEAEDVLARFVAATADLTADDTIARATGDNPFYCPLRFADLVEIHSREQADYSSVENLSYVVPEIIRVGALRAMAQETMAPFDREHVSPWLRRQSAPWKIVKTPATWRGLRPDLRLTVDTPEELERAREIVAAVGDGSVDFTLESVYEFLDRRTTAANSMRRSAPRAPVDKVAS